MTEPAQLLRDLHILRELLDMPTTLSPKQFKAVQRQAQRLGDSCWYYAGWYAAQPDQRSKGVGTSTLAKLERLIKVVRSHTKPKRGKGRPSNKMISYTDGLIALPAMRARGHKSQAVIVNELVKRGILDKKKSTEAHIKRLDRLAKRSAKASDKKRF